MFQFHVVAQCRLLYHLGPASLPVTFAFRLAESEETAMPIDLVIIPVAGRGTRLLPLTKSQPKEMLPVGRKPVVQYVVDEMAGCGVRRMLFITGPGKAAIENHFDIDAELITHLRETGKEELLEELSFERDDLEFFYTRQRRQLGLGHAVLCARPMVGNESFVVALGDSMIGLRGQSHITQRMIEHFQRSGAKAIIALQEVPKNEVIRYGIAQPKGDVDDIFELADLVEKPSVEEAPSQLAVAARYVFSAEIFDYLQQTQPGKGGEIQLTDAIRAMIRDGHKVLGARLGPEETRYDIGNFESYFKAFVEFALADPQYGQSVREELKRLL